MTAFITHLTYDVRTGLRDRSLLLMNYLFPLVFYVMMGALMGGINPTFKDTMIPAMMVLAMMSSCLLGMPSPIVAAREAGIFRSYKINGVPALSILVIPVVSVGLHMGVVYAIITLTAKPLFGALWPADPAAFIGIGILSTLAVAALGLLIGVVSSNTRATVLLAQLIFIPSMMLGGLMLPTEMLPAGLGRIALLLPATHIMNAFRGLAMGLPAAFDPVYSLVVLASSLVLSLVLSVYLFQWDSRNSTRRSSFLGLVALVPYILSMVLLG